MIRLSRYIIFVVLLLSSLQSYSQKYTELVRFDTLFIKHPTWIDNNKTLNDFGKILLELVFDKETNNDKKISIQLKEYYNSHPALLKLFNDTDRIFNNVRKSELDSSLLLMQDAFYRLEELVPSVAKPRRAFTYVSALHENILVHNNDIGIAIDRYLGVDYPMYKEAMTKWKIQMSDTRRIVVDALKAWIMASFPMDNQRLLTLKNYVEYWAYVYSTLNLVFPDFDEEYIFGFNKEQYDWIKSNVSRLYKNALEQGDFDSYQSSIINKYFGELPEGKLLPDEAPRIIGHYLSYWMLRNNKIKI